MKKFMVALVLASSLLFVPMAQASPIQIYATSIWINTGIVLTGTDTLSVSNPIGTWSWGVGNCGPAGDYFPSNSSDQWIPNGMSAELIAYVGTADLNPWSPKLSQGDPGLFEIGSASIIKTGLTGTLWLGCNDAWIERTWGNDNSGFVTADVTVNGHDPVPEPLSLVLLGSGMAVLAGIRRQRRK